MAPVEPEVIVLGSESDVPDSERSVIVIEDSSVIRGGTTPQNAYPQSSPLEVRHRKLRSSSRTRGPTAVASSSPLFVRSDSSVRASPLPPSSPVRPASTRTATPDSTYLRPRIPRQSTQTPVRSAYLSSDTTNPFADSDRSIGRSSAKRRRRVEVSSPFPAKSFDLSSSPAGRGRSFLFGDKALPRLERVEDSIESTDVSFRGTSKRNSKSSPSTKRSLAADVSEESTKERAAPKRTADKSGASRQEREEAKKLAAQARKEAKELAEEEKRQRKVVDGVNKRKASRADYAGEMIVELHSSIYSGDLGEKLRELLGAVGTQIRQLSLVDTELGVIQFKRDQSCEYDADEDMYVPIEHRIVQEPTAVVYIQGAGYVGLLEADALAEHVSSIRQLLPGQRIIYVIEGLHAHVRKLETIRNRAITGRVRELMGEKTRKQPASATAAATVTLESRQIFKSLLDLELLYHLFVIHTKDSADSADCVYGLTVDIAASHYKTRELQSSEALDIIGSVKSGTTPQDTLAKSLGHIKYVTPNISEAVAGVYKNMHGLLATIDKQGVQALDAIRKETGSSSTKVVGSALATAIHTVLTSSDPDQYLAF